jgi:hypothetical protein
MCPSHGGAWEAAPRGQTAGRGAQDQTTERLPHPRHRRPRQGSWAGLPPNRVHTHTGWGQLLYTGRGAGSRQALPRRLRTGQFRINGNRLRRGCVCTVQIPSWMHPGALQYLVHRVPGAVHRQSDQVEVVRPHGPHRRAVVPVIARGEEVRGEDRARQSPGERAGVGRLSVSFVPSKTRTGWRNIGRYGTPSASSYGSPITSVSVAPRPLTRNAVTFSRCQGSRSSRSRTAILVSKRMGSPGVGSSLML